MLRRCPAVHAVPIAHLCRIFPHDAVPPGREATAWRGACRRRRSGWASPPPPPPDLTGKTSARHQFVQRRPCFELWTCCHALPATLATWCSGRGGGLLRPCSGRWRLARRRSCCTASGAFWRPAAPALRSHPSSMHEFWSQGPPRRRGRAWARNLAENFRGPPRRRLRPRARAHRRTCAELGARSSSLTARIRRLALWRPSAAPWAPPPLSRFAATSLPRCARPRPAQGGNGSAGA